MVENMTSDAMRALLEQAERLLKEIQATDFHHPEQMERARRMARDLRAAAIDLSHRKDTEFSPLIEQGFRKALELMQRVCAGDDPELEAYRKEVAYYDRFQHKHSSS